MNFRQLEAFRATMKTGSVSAAANTMYISQPSVSRLLKELEDSLGIQLFSIKRENSTRAGKPNFCLRKLTDRLWVLIR